MKRLPTIIIIGLLILVLISLQSIRAQPPGVVTSGFWFMRKPQVPDHIKQGAREGLVLEINRLTILATIPLNDPDIIDYIGNPIIWDQAQLDAVNVKIAELQALLAQY